MGRPSEIERLEDDFVGASCRFVYVNFALGANDNRSYLLCLLGMHSCFGPPAPVSIVVSQFKSRVYI